MREEYIETIFDEFPEAICISDFGIVHKGTRIDYISKDGDRISFWAGNPMEDDYYEELIMTDEEELSYLEQISDFFC